MHTVFVSVVVTVVQCPSWTHQWRYWTSVEKSTDGAITKSSCRRSEQQIYVSLWTLGTHQNTGLFFCSCFTSSQ